MIHEEVLTTTSIAKLPALYSGTVYGALLCVLEAQKMTAESSLGIVAKTQEMNA
jgi:hypothetical protein